MFRNSLCSTGLIIKIKNAPVGRTAPASLYLLYTFYRKIVGRKNDSRIFSRTCFFPLLPDDSMALSPLPSIFCNIAHHGFAEECKRLYRTFENSSSAQSFIICIQPVIRPCNTVKSTPISVGKRTLSYETQNTKKPGNRAFLVAAI